MKRGKRGKFFVLVLESPSCEDLDEGNEEGGMIEQGLEMLGIPVERRVCGTRERFEEVLGEELADLLDEYEDCYPIIHISAHGDDEGFAFTSGDEMTWKELRALIRPINIRCDGALHVCLSMCEGFSGLQMAEGSGAVPFFALIGHTGQPQWAHTALGFLTFYMRRAGKASLEAAVRAMCVASGDQDFRWELGEDARGDYLSAA